ncbi:hypothetical protein ACPB67_16345 [Micromonospora taraxaci]|uniref:hypothetical protein n=1 Tax=Micromonospora taraxaci TaxID=1316803 RepID=UPI003C2F8A74
MTDFAREVPEPGADEPLYDDLADPLGVWARVTAVVLGTAGTGAGCVAVFATNNQAGTAVLLLVGAVLLLLGLQGTPLLSFGGGDYRFELARLRRRAVAVVDQIARQEPPDVAAAVADAVSAIDPGIRFPDWDEFSYQYQVRGAVQAAGASVELPNRSRTGDGGVDIRARLPQGTVNIQVVYRKRGPISSGEIAAAAAKLLHSRLDGGHLIVTNAPQTAEALRRAADLLRLPQAIEVVTCDDDAHIEELGAALRRNAR